MTFYHLFFSLDIIYQLDNCFQRLIYSITTWACYLLSVLTVMLFTLTVKSLLPQELIIQSLACAVCKDRSVRGHLGQCLVRTEGLFYQWPIDSTCTHSHCSYLLSVCIMRATPSIYYQDIVITDPCAHVIARVIVQCRSIYTSKLSQIYFT